MFTVFPVWPQGLWGGGTRDNGRLREVKAGGVPGRVYRKDPETARTLDMLRGLDVGLARPLPEHPELRPALVTC